MASNTDDPMHVLASSTVKLSDDNTALVVVLTTKSQEVMSLLLRPETARTLAGQLEGMAKTLSQVHPDNKRRPRGG